jgi:methylated-DNA-protein-cysteine methyltransferase-like protein
MDNFYEQVIKLTRAIPHGQVANYGHIALLLGNPRASRAVGYALRTLKRGTDVPWHRVVGKHGKMGKVSVRAFAYSHLEQFERLKEEGIQFDENEEFPLMDYLWQPTPDEVQAILRS